MKECLDEYLDLNIIDNKNYIIDIEGANTPRHDSKAKMVVARTLRSLLKKGNILMVLDGMFIKFKIA